MVLLDKFYSPVTTYAPKRIQHAAIKLPNAIRKPMISHTLAPSQSIIENTEINHQNNPPVKFKSLDEDNK